MNPDFLKYLQQITSALRGGLVFNPLDELQKRAQQYGEGVGNQIEHDRAVAGYARSHPESQRAQQQNMLNGVMLALGTTKPEADAPEMQVLEHRSPVAGLTTLDPSYQGTGRAGAESARPDRVPMLHAQTPGSGVEPQFKNDNLYHVAVPKGSIYDVATDPDGIVSKLRSGGNLDVDAMERAIQKAGYKGYNNSDYYPEYVKLYGKHDVIPDPARYGPTRTTIGPNDPVPPFWGTRLHSALTDNGGFTINPETGADLTSGYSVGGGEKSGVLLKKPLADLKPTELQSFLNANRSKLQPGQAWGGWVDNGQVYVEPADQVADLNEAQRLGNERGEQAIWDHANKTEIPLKAGKAGARQADQDEFSQVMDKWHSAWNDFESARDARNVASSRVKDVHDAISAFPEQRRQSLLNALRNPSTSETPWLSKYVQQDIPRPNGASPDKIADVEDIAYKTFNTPQFKKWLAAGQGTGTGYDTRETMGRAIDALGEKLGPQAFNQFIDHLAASTAMSRPENNIRRASWWRALNLQGLLNPEELRSSTLAAPEGMGHIAQRAHHFATADLVENGTINALANPKPAGFAANLKMNQRPVTFDTRMSNAAMSANPDMSLALAGKASDATPRKWAYAPIERAAQRVAAEAHARGDLDPVPRGVDPTATWQAQVWGGVGRADKTRMMSVDNPSFHAIVDQLLARSAKLWGVSPAKANELFWKGQPLDLPLDASLLKGPARKR